MELRHLRAFRAIMRNGTTVGAAESLGVSQPSISRLLAEMETAVGEPLFIRANGRLTPRAAAELMLADVERTLAGIDGLFGAQGRHRMPLRVAAPAGAITSILSKAARRLSLAFPDLRLSAEIMSYYEVVNAVAMGRVDLGLVKAPVEHPAVAVIDLVTVGTDVVMPQHHRLAEQESVSPADLAGDPLILLGRHRPFRVQVEQVFDAAGVAPRIVVETQAVSAACSFVREGMGLTIANALLARSEARDGLTFRPFRADIRHSFALVHEIRPVRPGLVAACVQEIRDVIADTVGSAAIP
jgi:DNA-binding transcriptional LysR family regulator